MCSYPRPQGPDSFDVLRRERESAGYLQHLQLCSGCGPIAVMYFTCCSQTGRKHDDDALLWADVRGGRREPDQIRSAQLQRGGTEGFGSPSPLPSRTRPLQTPRMRRSLLVLALYFSSVASLKVCSFNVRSFGENKVNKPDVLDIITKCIKRCDIMLMMEIKDTKGQALPQLMSHLNSGSGKKKNEFEFVISERLGRKSYKEQYAFIYRQRLVSPKAVYQYPDTQSGDEDAFSREPFVVWFSSPKTAVKEFVFIAIHTTPVLAVREIDELYDVQQDVKKQWTSQNFVFMGDFNAACGYVPKKQWRNIRLRSNDSFAWLIDDRTDTTVKNSTKCAYDRVVLHGDEMIEAVNQSSVEVFDFKTAYNLTEEQALAVSDHFPIGFSISAASPRCRRCRLRSRTGRSSSILRRESGG
ncbi:deoxyribonuclease gamma-like isoform X1 [Scleropages formosus]|uniref:deoxyribonuclease gamma-like isoform X1 n=1 Tax=Scleropages formosus TaxID=113540 RepID=UPI0010FA6612|nr:deoxyribonuclease gamma isoform X1 [Scleropages formosus]